MASEGVYRLARGEGLEGKTLLARADQAYLTRRGVGLRRVWGSGGEQGSPELPPQSGVVEKSFRVRLISGENLLSANAMNGKNTILSGMAQVKVTANIPPRSPRLFFLDLGINRFKGGPALEAPTRDATAFADRIRRGASGLYGEVQGKVLLDPGKGEIISTLKDLGTRMRPEDRFILFAATHGLVTDDRYWLITADYDGTLSSKSSITSEELMELSKELPALRQVLVLDTCHAGALDYAFSGLYESRFTSLALNMGMHVLSAAASYQEAQEDAEKYGHGLFTYYLLKALEGEADTNRDRQVTVIEVGPYVRAKVEKASSGSQKPFITNFGEDVVMGKVK